VWVVFSSATTDVKTRWLQIVNWVIIRTPNATLESAAQALHTESPTMMRFLVNAHLLRSITSALRTVVPLVLLLNITGCSPEDGDVATPQLSESKGRLTAPESGQQFPRLVRLDIRPGACPNPLNARSQGVFPATILGTDDFDVHDIDVSSIALEGVAPIDTKVKDKLSRCSGDGDLDDTSDDFSDQGGRNVNADGGGKGGHPAANAAATNNNDDDEDDESSEDDNDDGSDDVHDDCLCMFHGVDYRDACTLTEREPDGSKDLNLKFNTSDVIAALGTFSPGSVVVLTLTGRLNDGTPFEARDCVRIVGKPRIEMVSTPSRPSGPQQSWPGVRQAYCTAGATSSEGHPIEYQFDFDADSGQNLSAWADSSCAENTWSSVATFVIKARARCARHPDKLSEWSEGFTVTVAEVTQLPEIHFTTHITKIVNGTPTTITRSYDPAVPDTVGLLRPFAISYHGTTVNGMIRAYRFFSLTSGVFLEGQYVWTTDLSDTLRVFPNTGDETIPSGVFRLGVQCRDDAGAESNLDVGHFTEGVCQVAVEHDPDTRIFEVFNTYSQGGVLVTDPVD
jgi:hypothetical protein